MSLRNFSIIFLFCAIPNTYAQHDVSLDGPTSSIAKSASIYHLSADNNFATSNDVNYLAFTKTNSGKASIAKKPYGLGKAKSPISPSVSSGGIPTASNPAPLNVECIGDAPVDITVVTDEADDDGPPTVAFVSDVSDGATCPETITRTYSVSDICANSINVTQIITINDVTNPTASNPAALNVECVADAVVDITVVTDEADNCTVAPIVAFVGDVSDGATCPETITRTYSVSDDCGNTINVTQTITINDNTNPTASNLAPLSVQCISDAPADITAVTDEADNCTAAPVVAFLGDVSDGATCPETITRTYSVTDDCGNAINVTQTITINDNTNPTASNPAALNVQCAADAPVDITVVTDEADNCTAAPVVAFVGDISDGATCPETITRTYSITDDCGNLINVTQTITINDNTNPTASNPAVLNVQCAADAPVDIAVVTDEADNCTAAPVVAFVGDVSDGATCPETITRTYSVTDDCGNLINVSQTIVINDVINPTASNPAALNVQCVADAPVDITAVTDEADNCTATPVVAFVGDVSDGATCPETITRTYSVTDDCGNAINVTQTITINDITNPTASNPITLNVECAADAPADITVVTDEADNCTAAPIVAFVGDVSDGATCPETITRTYSVTDDCGNVINVTQTITINDITNPTASNPIALNVQCIADAPVDITAVTDEADNCTTVPVVAFVGDVSDGATCPETITRTYSVTDDCGNAINVTQTIIVNDITAPTASNPAPLNVQCAADAPVDITVVTDEADNCTAAPVVAFVGDISDGATCPETITRTYSVTDDCGNLINVTQTITINDNTNPTASNPATLNVECVADAPVDIAVVTDEADNCTAAPLVAFVGDVSDGTTCPETITRTYSVTDDCGNVINVSQTIIIDDVTAPTASNPAPLNVECAADAIVDITVVTDEADNCTAAPVVTFAGDASDGATCPETITRTYSVTDDCGNVINVSQTITINDITAPTASNPAPLNVECAADAPVDITAVADEADNCTAVPVVAFVGDVSDGATCPETITRTYSVTDDCGNTMNVTQVITVNDITAPTASNPAALNVQCIADAPVDITVVTDEADNCTVVPVVAFVGAVSDGGTCPETITRTYSVTDDCGNLINVSHVITVNDNIAPIVPAMAPINVECTADIPLVDILDVVGETDNCTATPTVVFVSDISDGGTCPEVITRNYSVFDDCSNVTNVTQIITVNDITPPTASNPAPLNVQCIADAVVDITVVTDEADNCTAAPVVAFVSDVSDGATCPETITRTYSVTDDCGNTINVTQTVIVNDNTAPTASNPAPLNVQCVADAVVDIAVVTDEADNCTAAPVVAFVGDVSDGATCPGTITRTYSVTDDCGNVTNVTQTIIVNDNIAPIVPAIAGVNVQCIGDVPGANTLDVVGETDNCTAAPIVAFVGDVSDGATCPETITRTYSVTDDCGNVTNVNQTITVNDNIAPTASNPAPLNVQCMADAAIDIAVVTDEADNCSAAPTVAFLGDVSDGATCPETITRTYSVTDDCGNLINVTQTIVVNDNIAPIVPAMAGVNVQCITDVPPANILDVIGETDNCTVAPTVALIGDASDGATCPETITRTYSVTDDCGNATNVTQTITVNDNTNPTASNPAPLNVQCIADAVVDITVVTDAADNCTATPVVAFVGDVSDGATCPETITRTYSVTDDCGNAINVTQTIVVNDDTAPVVPAIAAVNVQCIGDVPGANILDVVGETDNCTAAPIVTFLGDVSDGATCPETITRTYSVTDDCGNITNVTQAIIVNDNIAPTASNPAPLNVQCIADAVVDITVVTDEADNCTVAPTVAFVGDVSDGATCPETITRTYSVTDDCGNLTNVSQTIVVNDNIAPIVPALAAVNVQCIGDVPGANILDVVGETDNCTAAPTVVFVGDVSDGATCPETITRTYSITDDCGNVTNVTQAIIVNDNILPTASNPLPLNVQCVADATIDITVVVDAADNCTVAPTIAFVGDVSDGATCPETITRTYSVTDDCGNTINVTQTIVVNDDTAPVVPAIPVANVQCIGDVPAANILDVVGETDNCTVAPTVAFLGDISDGGTCPETISRTYSVTDDCGNATNVMQTIIINDNTPPTASNPAPLNFQCIADALVDITVVTDEADNCTAVPVVAFVGDVSDGATCPETITRTYSITDDCGNLTNVTQTITINDNISPVVPPLAAVNVECIGDVPPVNILDVVGETDNCTAVPTVTFVGQVSDGATCPETISRNYTVTDDCGNVTNVSQTITINDITPPTASNPLVLNVQCVADAVIDITAVTDAADNCTAAPTVAFVGDVSDGATCPETITRTYSVTDDCGNSINVTQTIVVNDDTAPVVPAIPVTNVQCIGDVPPVNILDVVGETDNCTAVPVVAFVSDVSDGATCPETITRTYTVTDDCGNVTNAVQTIIVNDDTNPTASNLAPVVVECLADEAIDIALVTDAADNCTAIPVVAFVSDVSDGGTCPEIVTRTYSVTDDCGNTINVTQAITVNDITAPVVPAIANLNVQCIGDVPPVNILDVVGETDNCIAAPTVTFAGDVSDGATCPETITRTYSVADDCGNVTNVTQTIIVNDNILPTASNPLPLNVQCIADAVVDITVVTDEADNCTVAPVIAFVSDVSDGATCPETITRTYSVTDDCGNAINVTQTIVVNDDIAPIVPAMAGVNVQCIADVPLADVLDVVGETDNCTVAPVVAFVSDVSDGATCPEMITRTYTVTDDCGNVTNAVQIITVNDDIDPTAPAIAAVNVECFADIPAVDILDVVGEADNCTAVPIVTFVSDVSDGATCPETITRTYAVADDCGNTINVTQIITVNDITAPVVPALVAVNVLCIADVPAVDVLDVVGETDNCTAVPIVAFVSDVSDGATCPETITRTYSVTDDCGNTTNISQTITVNDILFPTASNPLPLNIECIADAVVDITVVTDEADNCTIAPIVAFVSDVSDGATCPETITRTYSVTDDCGNSINVTQIVTINDITAPVVPALPILNVECIADVPGANILDVVGETDNCTVTPVVAFVSDVSDGATCPETITRTYSITDDCGNITNVAQTIIVDDNTSPVVPGLPAINVQCLADVPAGNILDVVGETDNCTALPTVTFLGDAVSVATCPTTILRTYSVSDDCGNVTNTMQVITVNDDILPTASNPVSTNVQCIGDVPLVDVTVVTDEADNCTIAPVVAFVSEVSDGSTCPEVITRTYSITDDCGNMITVEHNITVSDDINPTASSPAPLFVQCLADAPAANPDVIVDEADNCTVAPIVSFINESSDGGSCPEVITRNYSVTDDCGNSITVSRVITVNDDIFPTASNPAPLFVQCAGDVPPVDIEVVIDEADNCTAAPIVALVSNISDGGSCPEVITRIYSVSDDCGNTINVTHVITVNDDTPPTASNPAPLIVECPSDAGFDITQVTDAADNCTAVPAIAFVSDISDGLLCPTTITRTYSVTDDCGNSINVTQTVIINDVTAPTASNPAPAFAECVVDVPIDVTVVTDEADNCFAPPIVAYVGDVSDGGTCAETVTRTYSVTDFCGNTINVEQTITVNDITPPTASNPAPIVVQCIGDALIDVTLVTDEADNCTPVPTVTFVGDVSDGGICPETVIRTYAVTDVCGNTTNVEQTITVTDDVPPTGTSPATITVQCIADVPLPDVLLITDEADNCTVVPTVTFAGDVSDGATCPETITRSYALTDGCGNVGIVTHTILVNDDILPTATNALPIVIQCIADLPVPDGAVITDAADNCTAVPTVTFLSDVSDGGTCPEIVTRTYQVTDDCGNAIFVTQTITVNDDILPTGTDPAPMTVACLTNIPLPDGFAVVVDAADNCGVAAINFISDVSDGAICAGEQVTRTYELVDGCNNSINVEQLFTISTVIPPVSAGPNQTVCEGTAVTLTAENPSGADITWNNAVLDGVPFTPGPGTLTYTATASLCSGVCTATDDVDVIVNPLPNVMFTADTLIGCDPFEVVFTNLSTLTSTCVWDFGDGTGAADCGSQTHTYSDAGDYDVSLTVTSPLGCVNSTTVTDFISVINTPVAEFTPSSTLLEAFDLEVEFENTSQFADTYTWDFGDETALSTLTNPSHVYSNDVEAVYEVQLIASTNFPNCPDTAYATITVRDLVILYVPNAITLDGNAFNSEFKPIIHSGVDYYDYHLTIFNRWGEILFESFDYGFGWNGEYGNQGVVQDGVYVWQIEFKETGSDERIDQRGHVTVIR